MTSRLLATAAVAAALACTTACAGPDAPELGRTQAERGADATFVSHLRIRTAPDHTGAFEALMTLCISAARAGDPARGDRSWLCYREPPGRYWLIFFSDSVDGFAYPTTFPGFVQHLAAVADQEQQAEMLRRLDDLQYELEWELVLQQKASWSTVEGMSTASHPKARMMERTIRPAEAAAFDRALRARTSFLADHGYPLPIEGFITRRGDRSRALQVVFPRDWSSFYGTESFGAFVRGLDEEAQAQYALAKQSLMRTMSRAEYYDGNFAPELSNRPD